MPAFLICQLKYALLKSRIAACLRTAIKFGVLPRKRAKIHKLMFPDFYPKISLENVQDPCRLWRCRLTRQFSHQICAELPRALPKSTRSVPSPVTPIRRRPSNSRRRSKLSRVICSTGPPRDSVDRRAHHLRHDNAFLRPRRLRGRI